MDSVLRLPQHAFAERATMQLAMIGLGRMGGNMVRRLIQGGHEVIVYDQNAEAVKAHVGKSVRKAADVADIARQLSPRRVVWVMLPAGAPVESTIEQRSEEHTSELQSRVDI